jgi:DNA polymerase III gamma/tau subunit
VFANTIKPRNLSEIVGQDKVVKTLNNYFKAKTLPNVLYFIGQSGAGKTTFAYIVASMLVCDNVKEDKDKVLVPCCKCSSCLDIIEERFQMTISVYNGSDLTADKIRELDSCFNFSSFDGKPKVIIINESQLVKEPRRLLEIIEKERKDVYFIFTSTDRAKYSNLAGKDNKAQEVQAGRSRGAFFNINPIETKVIKDYLFELLMKLDPDEKLPPIFIEEGLQVIAENAHNNLRLAVNDFYQAIQGECYTEQEVRDILGYENEKDYVALLYALTMKNTNVIATMQELPDIQSFFYYSWKVLTDTGFRELTGKPFNEIWKEKSAKAMLATGNIEKLILAYEDTNSKCYGHFKDNVFFNAIYKYFKSGSTIEQDPSLVKRVKTRIS